MALSKANRLKKKADFDLVFSKGKSVKGSFLFIKFFKNSLATSRLGIIVPMKFFTKAFSRNRVKRIVSEVFRPRIEYMKQAYDMIVVINKKADINEIKSDLINLLNKSGLV